MNSIYSLLIIIIFIKKSLSQVCFITQKDPSKARKEKIFNNFILQFIYNNTNKL